MYHDPYSETQTRFHRTDQTGRYSPIYDRQDQREKAIRTYAAVFFWACVFAAMLYWGI